MTREVDLPVRGPQMIEAEVFPGLNERLAGGDHLADHDARGVLSRRAASAVALAPFSENAAKDFAAAQVRAALSTRARLDAPFVPGHEHDDGQDQRPRRP